MHKVPKYRMIRIGVMWIVEGDYNETVKQRTWRRVGEYTSKAEAEAKMRFFEELHTYPVKSLGLKD